MRVVSMSLIVVLIVPALAFGGETGGQEDAVRSEVARNAPTPLMQSIAREAQLLASKPEGVAQPNARFAGGSHRHSAKKATLIGLGIGAALGFIVGRRLETTLCEWDCPPGDATVGLTIVGAAGGALVGYQVGR